MNTPSNIRYNKKWAKEHMTTLCCRVRRDYADRVRQACADNGEAVNAVIRRALDDYLDAWERHNQQEEE